MKSLTSLLILALTGLVFTVSMPTPAEALIPRSWVSGAGDDANPCTRLSPCATLAHALSVTVSGGEVDCVDAGDFGEFQPVTITTSITIDCGGGEAGAVGAMFAGEGLNAITVQAGSNDVVQLRNLTINGDGLVGVVGVHGISFVSGKALHVENLNIMNFQNNGIDVAPTASATVDVVNTNIMNCGNNGIRIAAGGSGLIEVSLKGVKLSQGFNGLRAADNGSATVHVSIQDSIASSNANTGFLATTGGGRLTMLLEHSSAVNGGATGIVADGGNTEVHVSNSHIYGNGTGIAATGGASLISYKNNEIKLNGSNGSPTSVVGFD